MSEVEHGVRITAVEQDVSTIKGDLVGIKAQMVGFGGILARIEQGVASAQQQWQDDKQASRINPVALAAVLITIISTLVGGAWLISGGLATSGTRISDQDKSIEQMVSMRDRELDRVEKRLDRLELRGDRSGTPPPD